MTRGDDDTTALSPFEERPESQDDDLEGGLDSPRPRARYQFSINTLLLLMFLASMLFASVGGIFRGLRGDSGRIAYYYFVVATMLAPPAALIFASLLTDMVIGPAPSDEADLD